MLAVLSKLFVTLGVGFAAALTGISATPDQVALTDNSATSVPIDNPITASEFAVSLHNKITDLRAEVERTKLDTGLPLTRPLLLGSRGDDVAALQDILIRLTYLTDDQSTGYYGISTMKAVSDFQSAFQLPVSGLVDRLTLDKLFDITIARMDLGATYFPEEEGLTSVATTSEKLLADALNESCPAADPQFIYVPGDTIVQTQTQTVYVQPNPVTLAVSGANTAFTPKTLSVAQNTPVTISLTVTTGTHNFVIDAYNFRVATTTSTLSHSATFTASATGTFQFYSSVGSDKASGMTGTLTVY